MPKVEFIKPFSIAKDNGWEIVTWPVGVHEVDDECARIARANGFAKAERPTGGQTGPETQSSSPPPVQAKSGKTLKKPRAKRKS